MTSLNILGGVVVFRKNMKNDAIIKIKRLDTASFSY